MRAPRLAPSDAVPRVLDEHASKQLLASYGVPVVQELRAAGADEAVAAAGRIGYPVVLKGLVEGMAHKTEHGLVLLDLRDAQAVSQGARQVAGAMSGAMSGAMGGHGALLVQRMVRGRREFMAGLVRDAQFGPVVSFGLGGIFAEALADVAFRVCPLGQADALAMLDEIRARALLGPLRGLPAVDRDALARVLMALSRIAAERPDIAAIDINPLVIDGAMPLAVDALIELA